MTARSEEAIEIKRRKLMFRSWHRGTREMDLILGQFATTSLHQFTAAELDEYQRLIEASDGDLRDWITGESPVPAECDGGVLQRLRQFYERPGP